MIGAMACGHHQDRSKIRHFGALTVRNKALGRLIGGEGVHFVQHGHQLLVRVFENLSVCRASSCLDLINFGEPEISKSDQLDVYAHY